MTLQRLFRMGFALALLGVSAWGLASHIQLRTDLAFFMPESRGPSIITAKLNEGPASGLILLALSGGTTEQLVKASDQLANAIDNTGFFRFVANGRFRAPPRMIEALFRHRYILAPEVSRVEFSAASLRRDLRAALTALGTASGLAIARRIPADPTNRMAEITKNWKGGIASVRIDGIWLSSDGRRALLTAQTKASGLDLVAQRVAQDAIASAFADIRGGSELQLEMTGPAVFATESSRQIRNDMQSLTALSSVLVFSVLLAAFRSIPMVVALFVPLATGVLVAIAAVQLIFGHIHAISLTFGVVLIGVAVDYPVHLAVHGTHTSPSVAARGIWPTLRLGALTTVSGFIPIGFSSFPGLSQMGLFAIVGLLVAAATTRLVLPSIFPSVRSATGGALPMTWLLAIDRLRTLRAAVLLIVLAAAAYSFFGTEDIFDDDLSRLSPVPQAAKEVDRELRSAAGAPDVRYLLVIEGGSPEEVLQRSEDLQAPLNAMLDSGVLSGFDMASKYLPSVRTQKRRQQALPTPKFLQDALKRATAGLPFREGAFASFLHDVEAARTAPPITYETFQKNELSWLIEPLLSKIGHRWVGIITPTGLTEPSQLDSFVAARDDPQLRFVDLKEESDQLVSGYRAEAVVLLGWGSVAVLIVLAVGLRSVNALLRVCAPIAASVLATAALFLSVAGGLSLFHVLSLLVIVGVGLDYALFFDRYSSSLEHRRKALCAILICSATTICVFGVLGISEIPVLRSIGLTVSTGTALSLLLTTVFSARRAAQ